MKTLKDSRKKQNKTPRSISSSLQWRLEWEFSPTGLDVWTHSAQLVALFGKGSLWSSSTLVLALVEPCWRTYVTGDGLWNYTFHPFRLPLSASHLWLKMKGRVYLAYASFHITVYHWRKSGQELTQGRNLEAGTDAEVLCVCARAHTPAHLIGLLFMICLACLFSL